MTPQEQRNELLAQKMIKNLNRRNMEAFYCPTSEEAVRKVSELIEDGEEIEVDMEKGIIISESGEEIEFKKLPPFMLEILECGGLINYLKEKNELD